MGIVPASARGLALFTINSAMTLKTKKVENTDRAELTYQFFKNGVFRDDEGYERFPINNSIWNGLAQQHKGSE